MPASKVQDGPGPIHECMAEMPILGVGNLGTELGAVWECTCGRYYMIVQGFGRKQWEEVQDQFGTPIRYTMWEKFLNYWGTP